MSQQQKPSNEDSRLLIEQDDVEYLVELAKAKGFTDPDVATLYVVAAVGIPVENDDSTVSAHTEEQLREVASMLSRMIYDEKKQRLVGFNPPLLKMDAK